MRNGSATISIVTVASFLLGLNRLAALAAVNGQYDMLSDLHECAFIENYAVKPVKTWFEGWNSDFVKSVEKFDLYHTNALIELSENRRYTLTDDCVDLISDSEKDYVNDLEQRYIYTLLTNLPNELYVAVLSVYCGKSNLRC